MPPITAYKSKRLLIKSLPNNIKDENAQVMTEDGHFRYLNLYINTIEIESEMDDVQFMLSVES